MRDEKGDEGRKKKTRVRRRRKGKDGREERRKETEGSRDNGKGGQKERKEGKKRTAKRRKACAEGDMNNCQLDCAKHCYLLRQSQKSSPASTAITTSPLSAGATGRVTGFTKEVVRA